MTSGIAATVTALHRHSLRLVLALAIVASLARAAEPAAPDTAAPLTLEHAIELALANNQRLKVSAFGPEIARANVLAEYGHFEPTISFSRSYAETEAPGAVVAPATRALLQTDDYSLSLDGLAPWGLTYSIGTTAENQRGTFNGFTDNYATFGGVTVTQPLLRGFGFGANLAGLRIAKANRGISDWQHRQTVIDTVTAVVYAFNNLQQARENVRIARLSRDLAAQLLDENQKRHRVGAISDADVTQARARVATREEPILLTEQAARDLENQLRLLIGETEFPVHGAAIPLAPLPAAGEVEVNAAADVKVAYAQRPDYQAARLGVTVTRAQQVAAQNALLPRLDFVGSYGYGGLDPVFRTARTQVRDEDARAYSVGMVVKIPLAFTEGRGRARAARLALRQAEADLVRLEQDIAVSVAATAGQIETTRARVAATRQAFELQQQALRDEQKKFKAGTSSTFFVLQEQELLAAAENNYARAQADQRRAIASYDRETGRTLEHYQLTVAQH
ncbi:MAG TPA: TolC family protein [Opitutaceae bacterium]|nr:TolC family protein [Opitutaceae bacterium]HND61523.1 TolC family protein [Opitutaceae bacterium]